LREVIDTGAREMEELARKMEADQAAWRAGREPPVTDVPFVDDYERLVYSMGRAMEQSMKLHNDRRARDEKAAADAARKEALARRIGPYKRSTRH
jgi:hypothetical protein